MRRLSTAQSTRVQKIGEASSAMPRRLYASYIELQVEHECERLPP
jgi:hypothetical protein